MSEDTFSDDGEIVLQLDLAPGRNADAILAAGALVAWVEAAQAAGAAVGLAGELKVELVSAEPACLKLRTVFRFLEDRVIGPPADLLNDFPKLKKLAVATAVGIPAGMFVVVGEHIVFPEAPPNISVEAREQYSEAQKRAARSPEVREKVRRFYRTLERDPAVTQVTIGEAGSKRALVVIPRSEFAERGGLWDSQKEDQSTRAQKARWDVIVTHPALLSKPQAWRFVRDGLPFSATMADEHFLAAIKAGTLPIHVQEGVTMVVDVEWQERLDGQTWEVVPRTRKITRVISPTPEAQN